MTLSPKQLTTAKMEEHGDWIKQSTMSNNLKLVMRDGSNFQKLAPFQKEALDLIQVKVSRILEGDPNLEDHWDDIAGYAFLGKGGHDGSDS